MFGFFKDLMLVGGISNGLRKTVNTFCQHDYLAELSNKDRNYLADNVIKQVEMLHGKKIGDHFMPVDDLMIVGFLLLAKEIGENRFLDHRLILMGLMSYVTAAVDQKGEISTKLLLEATEYCNKFQFK